LTLKLMLTLELEAPKTRVRAITLVRVLQTYLHPRTVFKMRPRDLHASRHLRHCSDRTRSNPDTVYKPCGP
jgi:hypothetical protein